MHRSIQAILDRNKPTPAPKSFAWEWIAEYFGDNYDDISSCSGCEWNWGKGGCRLLHTIGPNEPTFCPAYEDFLNEGNTELSK
jgi:hypothetical protein